MNFNKQPHKHWHEDRPGQNVASDDVEAEVSEQHEAQPLEYGQLVRHLRVDLSVVPVVGGVPPAQGPDLVQGEVEGEEEGVVEEEADDELGGEPARRGWLERQSADDLEGRGGGEVVQRRQKK